MHHRCFMSCKHIFADCGASLFIPHFTLVLSVSAVKLLAKLAVHSLPFNVEHPWMLYLPQGTIARLVLQLLWRFVCGTSCSREGPNIRNCSHCFRSLWQLRKKPSDLLIRMLVHFLDYASSSRSQTASFPISWF